MKRYFLAEKLKYRHTFLPFLVVAMPLMTCLLAAFLTGNYFAVDSFNWWYMMMFPGMTAIICAVVGGKDKKQQNRTIFALPVDIGKVWDAKILTAAGMTAIANGILLAGAVAGNFCLTEMFSYTMVAMPAVRMQIVAAGVIWLTSLWQIPFCLWMSQKFGGFLMFLLHLAVYMVLAGSLSPDAVFFLLPQGITARLMCVLLEILPNGLIAKEGQMTWKAELMEPRAVLLGMVASVLWFILLRAGSRRWFKRQVENA